MPPPVADFSDDESTGESIPYDEVEDKKNGVEAANDADADDDEDGDEDEYVVEKILGHSFKQDGTLLLRVKWQGYDDPKDQTTEPEENLDNAQDVLQEYFKILGGRPEKPQKKRKSMGRPKAAAREKEKEKPEPKRRRRSRAADTEDTDAGEEKAPAHKETPTPDWAPKSKNWEKEVKAVDTILREDGGLVAYLHWNNDKKSKVSIETCYEKCPRKMLQFYESHLVFKDSDA
ncbi:chromo domain-containing protein [Aspergillus undulatus]|uniref:chromo domain-containing protein n=1 Tax=Aspergillus undulatus TaxID=1810928 RepID=UPI003CCE070D